MRRNIRKKSHNDKILIYSIAGLIILSSLIVVLLMYSNSLDKDINRMGLSSDEIATIVKNENDSESASSSIGKSVEESKDKNGKQLQDTKNTQNMMNNTAKANNITNNVSTNTNVNQNVKKENKTIESNTKETVKTENVTTKAESIKKELSFQLPVEGDITNKFAKENLIYSQTLQEWVTHTGIDIKADKTTVVKAAEDGTIKSIKNDPRYGLTIVIEHENGFETVYANLLSSEFVEEGEKVVKGQSIGTVGNTAAFESAEEPHLHFEILKDSIQVDPSIYLK